MGCNSPITGYQRHKGAPLTFTKNPAHPGRKLNVPCGQCWGCRLEKSRQWAMRCVNEASLHDQNCFLTLTYNEESLPENGSLNKKDLQRFWKRLRKCKTPFRYYACGEYGEKTQRAHYHACVFGLDFDDKIEFRKIGDNTLYISEELTKIWGHGNASIGEVNFDTAAYVARYVMKKQTGLAKGGNGYVSVDPETGEITQLTQPYANMSLRDAIGKRWHQRYHQDMYGHDKDYLVMRGKKLKPAKYYDKLYDLINPEHMQKIKDNREKNSEKKTKEELHAREKITRARTIFRSQI